MKLKILLGLFTVLFVVLFIPDAMFSDLAHTFINDVEVDEESVVEEVNIETNMNQVSEENCREYPDNFSYSVVSDGGNHETQVTMGNSITFFENDDETYTVIDSCGEYIFDNEEDLSEYLELNGYNISTEGEIISIEYEMEVYE